MTNDPSFDDPMTREERMRELQELRTPRNAGVVWFILEIATVAFILGFIIGAAFAERNL